MALNGHGAIIPKEFAQFIGKEIRLSKLEYAPRAEWLAALARLAEGRQHTLGALDRGWQ